VWGSKRVIYSVNEVPLGAPGQALMLWCVRGPGDDGLKKLEMCLQSEHRRGHAQKT
jgi:hypothetical protein